MNIWNITRSTMIQKLSPDEAIDISGHVQAHLSPFHHIFDYFLSRRPISIMAIVIYKLPRQIVVTKNGEQNVHDFVVMNEELKPIMLTLWGTFAVNQGVQLELQLRQGKFPIILAEGLNVNAFQGLSLSTLYNTSIEVDPVGHVAKVLTDWKDKNSELIYKEIVDKTYLDSLLALADPIRQRKTCLSSLETGFEQKPIAWVRGKIRLLKRDGFDYYVGCNYCNKIVHSTEGLQLQCMNCGQTDGITVKRYKVDIEIFDNVGSVRATMFNHEVHRLLLLTSSNIPTCENDGAMLQQTLDNLGLVFPLKKNTIFSEQSTKYTVACLCKDAQLDLADSNDGLFRQSLMLGNPTKRRLDFSQLSGDSVDDSQASSPPNDKGKKPKIG
ncbi:replication protein A 70 kDa DNA-binding subunit A-like [Ipomoea triloba]|uniref:replication protein A 70 kDa DNA-binding subunit A-like n=1 Tax=Ipomoea triloba TaxID=35885 RepID=UPI00125E2B11|nr:replication protein A 70 kDa DNA-binding subunit A-like [Ipomoea triloba]